MAPEKSYVYSRNIELRGGWWACCPRQGLGQQPRKKIQAVVPYPSRFSTLAQVSLSPTVRLNTGAALVPSGSVQK